jgi:hypothetical protein
MWADLQHLRKGNDSGDRLDIVKIEIGRHWPVESYDAVVVQLLKLPMGLSGGRSARSA